MARRSQPTRPHALADPESKLAAIMLASASSMKLQSERRRFAPDSNNIGGGVDSNDSLLGANQIQGCF
jgi:hypothetical protein